MQEFLLNLLVDLTVYVANGGTFGVIMALLLLSIFLIQGVIDFLKYWTR